MSHLILRSAAPRWEHARILGGICLALVVGCGSDARSAHAGGPPVVIAPPDDAGPGDGGGGIVPACKEGKEGCPCDLPGETAFCGTLYRTSGTYTLCFPGESVCRDDLTWSTCVEAADGVFANPGQVTH